MGFNQPAKKAVIIFIVTLIFYPSLAFSVKEVVFKPPFVITSKTSGDIKIITIRNGKNSKDRDVFFYITSDGLEGFIDPDDITNSRALISRIKQAHTRKQKLTHDHFIITQEDLQKGLREKKEHPAPQEKSILGNDTAASYYRFISELKNLSTELIERKPPKEKIIRSVMASNKEMTKAMKNATGKLTAHENKKVDTLKSFAEATLEKANFEGNQGNSKYAVWLAGKAMFCNGYITKITTERMLTNSHVNFYKSVLTDDACFINLQKTAPIKDASRKRHPRFNIKSYCKDVSAAGGGSYMIEDGCRQLERENKRQVERLNIPSKIYNYCLDVAKSGGGSYQILRGCIELELKAKKRL